MRKYFPMKNVFRYFFGSFKFVYQHTRRICAWIKLQINNSSSQQQHGLYVSLLSAFKIKIQKKTNKTKE